jgi:hypothetical protein
MLILSAADGLERYDLARDPLARVNLADDETAAELELLRSRAPAVKPRAALDASPGADTRRALEAFGYAGR